LRIVLSNGVASTELIKFRKDTTRKQSLIQDVMVRPTWVSDGSKSPEFSLDMQFSSQPAMARMYNLVITQAQALSYVEIYWLLASTSALMFLFFLLAKNEPGKGDQVAVH
jgi:hypothetical protein